MDKMSALINAHNKEVDIACAYLSAVAGVKLTSMDINLALVNFYGLKSTTELLPKRLSNLAIVTNLKKYDFAATKPQLIETVELSVSILPKELPTILTEETIKNKNEIWRIHKNDVDPFPHPIHAHNYGANVTLDLRDW